MRCHTRKLCTTRVSAREVLGIRGVSAFKKLSQPRTPTDFVFPVDTNSKLFSGISDGNDGINCDGDDENDEDNDDG